MKMEVWMENFLTDIPRDYYEPIDNGGTCQSVSYESKEYFLSGKPVAKQALVYLPAGYPSGKSYKTLYVMHGGGGNEREFLYGQKGERKFVNILDHMILNKDIEPMIVVAPTFYYSDSQSALHDIHDASLLTKMYHREFRNDLLPFVEKNFNVLEGRENRAFTGFSMGAETTWEMFLNALDLVKFFFPLSGDCWISKVKGGVDAPAETVEAMIDLIKENGFENLDYDIFAMTGTKDIAYEAMEGLLKELNARHFGENANRLRYVTWPEGVHSYDFCERYLYNILPKYFG